jgi:hypothetical protein
MIRKLSRPLETLTLEFKDGTTRNLQFAAYASFILDDEFEGTINVLKNAKDKPFLSAAKLIYAGGRVIDESFTYNDAKKITVNMTTEDIAVILEFVNKSLGETKPQ